jgi:HD-GYP domain-containing protein (c-di-GMP phosphodiesterase class II)
LARIAGTEVIVQAILHDGRRIGLLAAGGKSAVDPDVTSAELRILCAAAELIGIFHENACRFEEHRAMFLGTLRSLTASIDAKDPYTRGHSQRVALLAGKMAAALDFDSALVERYRIAGLVHDAGKIGVPEAVLCKCGRLTESEFALIKRHPEIGYGILKDIPGLADVLSGVLHHHERWDGGGYPRGLNGESIPLMARVLALADTFDAMSSDRSYRKRIARDQVLAEIRRCAGTQFDPALAAKFVSLSFVDFDKMFLEQSGVAPLAA